MHPIENILNITMSELKEMADVNTIVGKPFVTPEGQTIIPISKISLGFVSGGGEYGCSEELASRKTESVQQEKFPFAGGSGAGITIRPVAFVITGTEPPRLLNVTNRDLADKILEHIPDMVCEISRMFKKEENEEEHKFGEESDI